MSSYRTRNDKLSASATATNPSWPMWAAAWVVTAVFILSNSATPLYVRWQTEIGFSSTTLTAVFAAYILGLLLTLLVAGQLSDHFGRRPVLIPGLLAAIAACLLFAGATSVIELIAARFLSGVAVGVVVSAGMAAVVDLGGTERKRQASLIASVSMVLGAGLGPLLAGGIASAVIEPVVAIFAVELAILLSAGIALLILPLKQGSLGSDRPLRLHLPSVPPANRRHLLFGISIFGPGITATSFVLSLGPSLLSRLLEISSPLVAGGMACTMFLAATGIQFATHRLSVRTVFLMGAAATVFAMTGIVLAITFSNPIALGRRLIN
ncbi:MFS transporter [Brucella sp. 22210]|uniref:MFS transporter n=1 Tax=Brucella sp. 22210 TaxID=3453892 RepID=UPI003F8453ED